MDFTRALDVLVICVPVFAVMGLGKLLERNGRLNDDHCSFINWLVYYFSLPALVFNEVVRQRFSSFLDPAIVVAPLIGIILVTLLTMLLARFNRFKGGFAAAFVYCTFWANATYIGMPLCFNAFGGTGLAKAAIYNSVILPAFIIFGYLLIGFYGAGSGDVKTGARIKKAFLNPILIAAVLGILLALVAEQFRGADGSVQLPAPVMALAALSGSFLKLIGSMGLPLALLSIGASLKWEQVRSHVGALCWTVAAKLILLPLVTLLLIRFLFPATDPVSLGVAVVLAGAPSAVACYVISCQLNIEKGFVSSMLVLSTALSVITIPLWMYIIKGFGG